jgi:bis(5'-nucleosyl)-tetraphosphatase (symmetrical)
VRWLVGDLQGCAREFEALLGAIDFDAGRDELWCVGDLINRGPDSLATLRLWRDIDGKGVLGNHEVYALSAHTGAWPRKVDTLQALYDAPDGAQLLERLRALPLLAKLPGRDGGSDTWVVHAGLHPTWVDLDAKLAELNDGPHDQAWLERKATKVATRVRCIDAAGEMVRFHGAPKDRPPGCYPWDARRPQHEGDESWVVHGHWARRGHYINPDQRVIGLDSGCVYGGPLTAYCVEESRIVQVDALR